MEPNHRVTKPATRLSGHYPSTVVLDHTAGLTKTRAVCFADLGNISGKILDFRHDVFCKDEDLAKSPNQQASIETLYAAGLD